ncbi:uncharacterized protein ARMOST_13639 [Armillaria ostoyae]|uniref:Uncharacterized protein n=1 Tax=Armillaria ostoyae TaxID=47428 RepID=A0A284RNG5_ARMOS|nr:uncharacterized protein ARMOST_13639 [Armillaria ostoyae]
MPDRVSDIKKLFIETTLAPNSGNALAHAHDILHMHSDACTSAPP